MISHDDTNFYIDGQPKPNYEIINIDLEPEQLDNLVDFYMVDKDIIPKLQLDRPIDNLIHYVLTTAVSTAVEKLTITNKINILSTYVRRNLNDLCIIVYDEEIKNGAIFSTAFEKVIINYVVIEILREKFANGN